MMNPSEQQGWLFDRDGYKETPAEGLLRCSRAKKKADKEMLGIVLARRTDPATSHAAAERIAPKLSERRREVLGIVAGARGFAKLRNYEWWSHAPITAGEVARIYVRQYDTRPIQAAANTPSKRIPELLKMGLIRIAGERKCSDSGYECQTYSITDAGRSALEAE